MLEHDELGQIPVEREQSPNFPLTTAGMAQFPEPDAQAGKEGGFAAGPAKTNVGNNRIIVAVSPLCTMSGVPSKATFQIC